MASFHDVLECVRVEDTNPDMDYPDGLAKRITPKILFHVSTIGLKQRHN